MYQTWATGLAYKCSNLSVASEQSTDPTTFIAVPASKLTHKKEVLKNEVEGSSKISFPLVIACSEQFDQSKFF